MHTLNVLTENPATDPALIHAAEVDKADAEFDAALTRRDKRAADSALARLTFADDLFSRAVPTTPAGIRRKIEAVCSLLRCCEAGNILTSIGATEARQHLESVLAAIVRPRQVS